MPLTNEQKADFDLNCYGMLRGDLAGVVDDAIAEQLCHGNPAVNLVASMLSDVQEMIERDMKEEARRKLNVAKFILWERIDTKARS